MFESNNKLTTTCGTNRSKNCASRYRTSFGLDAARPEISLVQNGSGDDSEDSPREVPLGLVPRSDDSQSTSTDPVSTFHVALPQSRLGKFSVIIRYRLARPIEPSPAGTWQLPLVQPLDGELGSHHVACPRTRRFTVSLDSSADASPWRQISSDDSDPNSGVEFVATQPAARLPLIVQSLNANAPAETFVDRVWLQTWVSGDLRQDRAAFRFRTAGSQVAVELAPQTPEALEVMLDGERAQVLAREPGRVVVAVSQPQADTDTTLGNETTTAHTLELRYRIPIRTALVDTACYDPAPDRWQHCACGIVLASCPASRHAFDPITRANDRGQCVAMARQLLGAPPNSIATGAGRVVRRRNTSAKCRVGHRNRRTNICSPGLLRYRQCSSSPHRDG